MTGRNLVDLLGWVSKGPGERYTFQVDALLLDDGSKLYIQQAAMRDDPYLTWQGETAASGSLSQEQIKVLYENSGRK